MRRDVAKVEHGAGGGGGGVTSPGVLGAAGLQGIVWNGVGSALLSAEGHLQRSRDSGDAAMNM